MSGKVAKSKEDKDASKGKRQTHHSALVELEPMSFDRLRPHLLFCMAPER